MKNLVDAHLERIPGDVFLKIQESIKRLVSKQHGVYALTRETNCPAWVSQRI